MKYQATKGKAALFTSIVLGAALALCLTACGGGSSTSTAGGSGTAAGSYKDGTYTGESSVMDDGVDGDGYAIVSVTVKDGAISDATCEAFLPDGTPKDDSYGKGTSSYSLAQKIIGYVDDYAADLVSAGTPEGVDVISGATYLHDQFVEAATNALGQAK